MEKIELKAYGKINLGLDVIRKRPDGYHDLDMIMQMVDVYDDIVITKNKTGKIEVKTDTAVLSNGKDNLAYMAAKMLMDEFDIKEGLTMNLEKFIPVAAGMAGGSSDAAAAFVGVNRLFGLGLSEEELMKRAVKVGADVPYCVMRGTALAEGIGEKLTRLPRVPYCYVLVGKPGVNVSTKTAYENLKLDDPAVVHPDIDGMVTDVRNGDLDGMISRMGNVFEPGIISKYPVIQEIKDLMESNGARKAMMSGSGPTVFGIFDDKEKMDRAAAVLRESRLAKTVFATDVF